MLNILAKFEGDPMRWRGRVVTWSWGGGWCSVAVAESRALQRHRQVGPPLRSVGLLALL